MEGLQVRQLIGIMWWWTLALPKTSALQGGFFLGALTTEELALKNLLFMEQVSFETDTSSLIECAAACLRSNDCYCFTLIPLSAPSGSTCRGYSAMMTSAKVSTSYPGAQTFHIRQRTTSWLEKECVTNADCPGELSAQCFADRCRCTPGYFYSHATDMCTTSCAKSDLQPHFTEYPKYGIHGYNLLYGPNAIDCRTLHIPLEDCKVECLKEPQCVNLEYLVFTAEPPQCCFHAVTALDVPAGWRYMAKKRFFQRTCV
ncbi:uncharacterized protein [Littorina saxatilis]